MDIVRSPTVIAAAVLAAVNVASYMRITKHAQDVFGFKAVATMLRAEFATQVVVPIVAVVAVIANEREKRMDPQSSLVLVVLANAAGLYYSYKEYSAMGSGRLMSGSSPSK